MRVLEIESHHIHKSDFTRVIYTREKNETGNIKKKGPCQEKWLPLINDTPHPVVKNLVSAKRTL